MEHKGTALKAALLTTLSMVISQHSGFAQVATIPNTGQEITPTAPRGSRFVLLNPGLVQNPNWIAGQPVTTVASPDGKTLLVLTSGYNRVNGPNGARIAAASNEYVFVFDVTQPVPVQKQVIQVPNTYTGIVFHPSGDAF